MELTVESFRVSRRTALLGGVALAVSSGSVASRAAASVSPGMGPRPMCPVDLLSIIEPSAIVVSPDGTKAFSTVKRLSPDKSRYLSSIFLLDLSAAGASPRAFLDGTEDSAPSISPDGGTLAFLRKAGSLPQLYIKPLKGGTERALPALERGVSRFWWAPDGRSIAALAPTSLRDTGVSDNDLRYGVHTFLRPDYRFWDKYVDWDHPDELWVMGVDPADLRPRQLSRDAQGVVGVAWLSPSELLYTCKRSTTSRGGNLSVIWGVSASGGLSRKVAQVKLSNGTFFNNIEQLVPSPSGKKVAFVTENPDASPGSGQGKVFVVDLESGNARDVTTEHDGNIVDTGLTWRDDDRLIALSQIAGASQLIEIDQRSGITAELGKGDLFVTEFGCSNDKDRRLCVASDGVTPSELYDASKRGRPVKLTDFNAVFREEILLSLPEVLWFTGPGGQRVEAFIQHPPGFDARKRYPLVLWVHGGPWMMWDRGFNPHVQTFAGAGYVVLYVNPRGSISYGQAFASTLKSWPGGADYDDLMAAVDNVAMRPYIDNSKMGIAGGSVGGTITDWAITHTSRFAAAVSISDIADFEMMWYVSDQPNFGPPATVPFLNPPKVSPESPLTYVRNVKTPTMFIAGTSDYRVIPSAGAEKMYRALQYMKVPTAYILFEGAGHVIHTAQIPMQYAIRNRHIIRWFDKFLLGVPVTEYDP